MAVTPLMFKLKHRTKPKNAGISLGYVDNATTSRDPFPQKICLDLNFSALYISLYMQYSSSLTSEMERSYGK